MWSTELDVLFGKSVYTLDNFVPLSGVNVNTTGINGGYSNNQQAATTPHILVVQSGKATMSPEFVNYILVLIIYSLRYAAVYWYTNITFSTVFAFVMLVTTLHNVFAYCGMGILYKFSINIHALDNISLVLSHTSVMVLYLLSCAVMFCSTLAIFNYGYCHYVECCRKFLKLHFPTYARYIAKMPVGCHGYIPHLLATMSLVMYVGLRAPIVYDYVSVYRVTGFPIVLTCIVMDAVYMMVWIGLWLAFTIKQSWDFKVNPQMDIVQQPQQRNAMAMATRSNGNIPQAEITVIGNTVIPAGVNGDFHHANSNGRQPPSGSSGSTTSNNSNPSRESDSNGVALFADDNDIKPPIPDDNSDINKEVPTVFVKPLKPQKPVLPPLNIIDSSQDSNNILNTDQESMQQQGTTPISPTSALKKSGLRKSGERRHNAPQRVTFDESVDHIDNEVANINAAHDLNLQHSTGRSQQNVSPTRKKKIHSKDNTSYDPQNRHSPHHQRFQHPESMTPPTNSKNSSSSGVKNSKCDNPENTLTRNYRSSLRDKCGQYYKHLGDLIPPAAQSSPLPRGRPHSDSFEGALPADEILLNPLKAAGKYPNNDESFSTGSPGVVSKDYFQQRAKSADGRSSVTDSTNSNMYNRDRLRDPTRLSGRKSNDDSRAYSYPPQLSSNNNNPQHQSEKQFPLSSQMNNGDSSQPFYLPPRDPNSSSHLLRPISQPHNYSNTSSHSPNSNSTIYSDLYYPYNIAKDNNNKPYLKLNSPYEGNTTAQQQQNSMPNGQYIKPLPNHLKRQLEINTKPELNRRDSALPSSNETSSNESAENILCSQV